MDSARTETYKKCRKCGNDISDANKVRNKNYSDGIATVCSECNKDYSKQWRRQAKESGRFPPSDLNNVELHCTHCGERLSESTATPSQTSPTGYASWCRKCTRLNARLYRKRIRNGLHTPTDTLGIQRVCYICKTPLTEDNTYRDMYASTGLGNACKSCKQERRKTWAKTHPEQAQSTKQKRRSRKRSLPSTLTAEEWIRCKDYFDCSCVICGSHDYIQMDHWIPLSNPFCPGTVAENVIPLCRKHNAQKNGQHPYKYLVQLFGVSEAKVIYDKVNAYFQMITNRI